MNRLNSKYLSTFTILILALAGLYACDDNTGTIGTSTIPVEDSTKPAQALFDVYTTSVKVDSLTANTSECFLGRVTDPETGATTTCNFLLQFYCFEDYSFPALEYIHKENNLPAADEVTLNMFVKSFYGDSLNSLKVGVYELDEKNIMEEGVAYFTNLNPDQYVKKENAYYTEKAVSLTDYEISDSLRFSSSYSRHISVKLPREIGSRMLQRYYENPNNYKNPYTFVHNVMPGLFVKLLAGNGTMMDIDVSTLDLYFRYQIGDSVYDAMQRVAATEEVLQNNSIENRGLETLLTDETSTYLKTPAGIFTEMNLPVLEIYEGHEMDSINSAKIVFQRRNSLTQYSYKLPTAASILLLPKSELNTFFVNHKIPNNTKEFIANFNTIYNSYTFDNIANLIANLKREHDEGANIKRTDDAATRKSKGMAWEKNHPEWNKVVLVPISYESGTMGGYTKVFHNFGLTSTKLVGGKNNPITLSVVYSRFNH